MSALRKWFTIPSAGESSGPRTSRNDYKIFTSVSPLRSPVNSVTPCSLGLHGQYNRRVNMQAGRDYACLFEGGVGLSFQNGIET